MATGRSPEKSILAARLSAQRLSGEPAKDVVEATRHLLAVQAQDPRGVRLALRARSASEHASDLDEALNERSVIITWVNRGTLHLVAAEDEPLLHALTTPQLRTGSDRRLAQEGVSPATARRAIDRLTRTLGEAGAMTRGQIRDVLDRAGVPRAGQALIQILFRATLDGLIVRGPMVGSEQAFVLVAEWLGERPRVDRQAALAELARRYLRGHGPADEHDLARWAGLPLRDARAGLRAIAPELVELAGGLVDIRRPQPARLPPPRLLGAFEPLLLGWRSRSFVLRERTSVVTLNGIFRPIALVRGQAVGTWAMPAGRVKLALWDELPRTTVTALEREARTVQEFLAS